MDKKTKEILIASGSLAAILVVVYFLTRDKVPINAPEQSAVAQPNVAPVAPENFSIPGLTVPNITQPGAAPNAPITVNACCKRCAGAPSAGEILQSGEFFQQVYKATAQVTQPVAPKAIVHMPVAAPAPQGTGPLIEPQNAGGLPLPSPSWWNASAAYRNAYIQAYNQNAEALNAAQIAYQNTQHGNNGARFIPVPIIPFNETNVSDLTRVTNAAIAAGVNLQDHVDQGSPINGSNGNYYWSMLQDLQGFKDSLAPTSQIGVPDQTPVTIQ